MSMQPEIPLIEVSLTLNGTAVTTQVAPVDRLLDMLRETIGLTGTKEGCGEGECGACTVIMDGIPVNSCLVPAWQARGRTVETVESIDPATLQPMLESGATQCGACTPGVVMTACWIRRNAQVLDQFNPRQLMAGNLCRCTGYDGIINGLTASLERD